MRNLEKLAEEVKAAMEEMSGKKVKIYHGLNRNGKSMTGLTVHDSSVNISPVVYLDPEKDFDVPVVVLAKQFLEVIEANMPKADFDTSQFTDFERAKERIIMTLINREHNKDLLEKVPYIDITGDLVVIFKYNVMSKLGQAANIVIRNEHAKKWGVSPEALYSIAETNTARLFPPEVIKLASFVSERLDAPVADVGYYILTNKQHLAGATTLAYPLLMKRLCRAYQCKKLLILPSSVDELLIYPAKDEEDLDGMAKESLNMVHEVSATLDPKDFLSDSVYVYDSQLDNYTVCK